MMSPEVKELTDIKLKVSLLEKDIEQMSDLTEKVGESIEKIQEMSLNLVKMITIHEQRHTQHESAEKDLKEDIKELHSRITTVNREIHDRIDQTDHHITARIDSLRADLHIFKDKNDDESLNNKVSELEKWRWMVAGGLVIVSFILGNLNVFDKILH